MIGYWNWTYENLILHEKGDLGVCDPDDKECPYADRMAIVYDERCDAIMHKRREQLDMMCRVFNADSVRATYRVVIMRSPVRNEKYIVLVEGMDN